MCPQPLLEPDDSCRVCGRFGAYTFAETRLCMDCYQARGSCCAEQEDDEPEADRPPPACARSGAAAVTSPVPTAPAIPPGDVAREAETLRLNPNCCYQACPRCSSMRRLREFQARHPHDWRDRLRGPVRLLLIARQRV